MAGLGSQDCRAARYCPGCPVDFAGRCYRGLQVAGGCLQGWQAAVVVAATVLRVAAARELPEGSAEHPALLLPGQHPSASSAPVAAGLAGWGQQLMAAGPGPAAVAERAAPAAGLERRGRDSQTPAEATEQRLFVVLLTADHCWWWLPHAGLRAPLAGQRCRRYRRHCRRHRLRHRQCCSCRFRHRSLQKRLRRMLVVPGEAGGPHGPCSKCRGAPAGRAGGTSAAKASPRPQGGSRGLDSGGQGPRMGAQDVEMGPRVGRFG